MFFIHFGAWIAHLIRLANHQECITTVIQWIDLDPTVFSASTPPA